jgi:hypothetical protein
MLFLIKSYRSRIIVVSLLTLLLLSNLCIGTEHKNTSRNSRFITYDSLIRSCLKEVSIDSVRSIMQRMQDFRTRYCMAPNRDTVVRWVSNKFISMGYTDVTLDSFQFWGTWQKNIIVSIKGTQDPSPNIIFGAHYDSWAFPDSTNAPGADDNASGIAAIMELARVLKMINYQSKLSLKFIAFGVEEKGEIGSTVYARKAKSGGMNISLMVNHDIIAYPSPPYNTFRVNCYPGSEYIYDQVKPTLEKYTTLTPLIGNLQISDHASFGREGYPAIFLEETEISPLLHSANDIVANCNLDYCTEIIKSSFVILLQHITSPAVPSFVVQDAGDGSSLRAQWRKLDILDNKGIAISIGKESGDFDTTFLCTDSVFYLRNLTEGVKYFISASFVDSMGFEGPAVEYSMIPMKKPRKPESVVANPDRKKIEIQWASNKEYDLKGYNVYRSTDYPAIGVKLNTTAIRDTCFIDSTVLSGKMYFYQLTAVDSTGNESEYSTAIKGRLISLDHGIVAVCLIKDGEGNPASPGKTESEIYYSQLLENFNTQLLSFDSSQLVTISDISASSSVWLINDNYLNYGWSSNAISVLRKYLEYGGNVFISGYLPSRAFADNQTYTRSYSQGDFIFDFLKILQSYWNPFARCNGAFPALQGYPAISTDSVKVGQSLNYHLGRIESFTPTLESYSIYKYNTMYDTNFASGGMKGLTVGIEYIGRNYRMILVSLPLYFMNFKQTKEMINYVMVEKFSELMRVRTEMSNVPHLYLLEQNYPNPFNGTTNIEFTIARVSSVSLKIFDMLGREVTSVLNEKIEAGTHRIRWNAGILPSGIYFYRLRANEYSAIKKMIIVR